MGCCHASLQPGGFLHFFLVEGYLYDWLTAAAGIVINLLVPCNAIEPLNRYYNATDPTLMYPIRDSSVPNSALYVLTFALPAVVFAVAALLRRSGRLVDWHHAALSVAEAFALTTGFKRWINLVGRYRPNWLATLAQGDASSIDDARLAYPSGHSAYLFGSMTIVSLYVLGKLELMHRPSQLQFLKSLLALAPIALATFVAVSRIADYKHDPSDVNAGCFIGIAAGAFAYFLNYPPPFEPGCAHAKRRGAAAVAVAAAAAEDAAAGAGAGDKDAEAGAGYRTAGEEVAPMTVATTSGGDRRHRARN